MSSKLYLGVAGLAALAATTASMAQLAPGMSGKSTMSYMAGQEALNELVAFGRCYAVKVPASSLRFIATEPSSVAEAEVYRSIFRKTVPCLGGADSLRAQIGVVRGVIAEGLYKGKVPLPAELGLTSPEPAEVRNLAGAARCYVGRHRQEARSLVEGTRPGTAEEREAVAAAMPKFLECVPSGAKAGFSPSIIRFRVAEALYRTAPPQGS